MAEVRHAVYAGTRSVYGDMEAAAKSLVANSDVGKVHFLIEDERFPAELPGIIECHNVSGQAFFPPDGASSRTGWTYMALMRCALALMPEFDGIDRILSLDCDTVCVRDIDGIWDVDIEGCYFAATPEEWARIRPGLVYCNTGVAVHNLAMLRDGKAKEMVDVINSHRFGWPDQDALNYLCQGRIAGLPPEYNWNDYVGRDGSGKVHIVHYAARRDWRSEPPAARYRDMPWEEALARHSEHMDR